MLTGKKRRLVINRQFLRDTTPQEAEGVICHELTHMRLDSQTGNKIMSGIENASALTMLGGPGIVVPGALGLGPALVPAGLITTITAAVCMSGNEFIRNVRSRHRENIADRGSARMTGAPEHLASALEKRTGHGLRQETPCDLPLAFRHKSSHRTSLPPASKPCANNRPARR
jgi:Zn-dependent protease with chaperone function